MGMPSFAHPTLIVCFPEITLGNQKPLGQAQKNCPNGVEEFPD